MKYTANCVVMVAPTSFQFNEENAGTNHFQNQPDESYQAVRDEAQAEFDAAVEKLRAAGVRVLVHVDGSEPPKPDAVFPNNWFTTWLDGRIFTYPMAAHNRRLERDTGIIDDLRANFAVREVVDLTAAELRGRFLEGTGAMVFDHTNKTVFACTSLRCDEGLLREHTAALGYEPVIFHAYGIDGAPIYHTNVVVAIHGTTAVVCAQDISDSAERAMVVEALGRGGRQVIEITHDQLRAFCANTLELQSKDGQALLVLSQTAYDAFTPEQQALLSRDKKLVVVAVPIIEKVGGGGVRCMLGEVFLPEKVAN